MIGLAKLEACYKGEQGKQLDAQARDETNSLSPAHTYVPWVGLVNMQQTCKGHCICGVATLCLTFTYVLQVTVNGIPIGEQVDYLASYICAASNGSRPEACYKLPGNKKSGYTLANLAR